jgi:hypothetical protein
MTTKTKSKLCFVIGPIGDEDSDTRVHADWLLEEIIAPVMQEFPDFRVERADKLPQPGLIDAQVIDRLLKADLVIADLSFLNPNAFYEIGIRHMAQKPIIHMQTDAEKPPFDVSLYRAIKFSLKKPSHLKQARDALRAQISAVLAEGYEVENPVTSTRGRIRLEEHATPDQKVLLEHLEGIQDRLTVLETNVRARDWMEPLVFSGNTSRLIGATKPDAGGATLGDILGTALWRQRSPKSPKPDSENPPE